MPNPTTRSELRARTHTGARSAFALARRLTALAALAATVAFGALTASAAPLGGLSSTLVWSAPSKAACDPDGTALAYTNVYDAASNDYRTTAVTLSGVASPCSGKAFQLTLSDGTASLSASTGTVTLASGSQTVTLTTPVSARAVTRVSLVITG